MSITWSQALSWRLERHLLDPVGTESIPEVIQRLGAVLATDQVSAELSVGARRAGTQPGDLGRALAAGEIVRVFAFRGATHYLSPQDGGAYLALRCAGRQWELPSWQEYYQLTNADWPAFRKSVRDALTNGPLTAAELGAAVTRHAAYRHLRPVFADGAYTLIKPLTWQGDMGFAPSRDGQATFQLLADNPQWVGIWDLDEAGPHAIRSYLRSYGPATPDHLQYWLGNGLSAGRKRLQRWLAELSDELVAIDVDGETGYVLSEDVDSLMAARPTDALRLLPGHDQWVMGPGTSDPHVVPPAHRNAVTRKANLVVAGGVVCGTWSARAGEVEVTWFDEHGGPRQKALDEQVEGLGAVLGRPLRAIVQAADAPRPRLRTS